jgi:hypothetical protein
MRVTVVCVTREVEQVVALDVDPGTTVAEAIAQSGVLRGSTDIDRDMPVVGIWNRVVAPGHAVGEGDRIEIYRPLLVDPKHARRLRADRAKKRRRQPQVD